MIIFIVEGVSDEETLMPWIEKKLRELNLGVKVKIMAGDKLTQYIENTQNYDITPQNVKGKVQEMLKEFMNSSNIKADYLKWKDIFKVYYITDTDNCFQNKNVQSVNKKECLKKMFNFETVGISKNNQFKKFEIILFSNNLEHVLYGNLEDLTNMEKEELSKEFGEKTLREEWNFKEKFKNSNIKYWNSYKESYKEIQLYEGRATNITVLIEEIENNFK